MRRLVIPLVTMGILAACGLLVNIPKAATAQTVRPPISSVSYTDIGGSVQILGRFGLPLGRYLTLEGTRIGMGRVPTRMGAGNFLVQRVNGKAAGRTCTVWINRVTALPAGTRCVLTGYETGEMIGVPPEIESQVKGPVMQAAWQFSVRLVVLKVSVGASANRPGTSAGS